MKVSSKPTTSSNVITSRSVKSIQKNLRIMSTTNNEANQLLQRLGSLKIVETPKEQKELGAGECYSLDSKKYPRVPATPCSGPGKFENDLKKRRRITRKSLSTYEADKHFTKVRKSLNFESQ